MDSFPALQPRLLEAPARQLLGCSLAMSRAEDQTALLWRTFMPRRREITSPASSDLFSVTQYPPGYFAGYHAYARFRKWAAVAVDGDAPVPRGLDALTVPAGLYAVFDYCGSSLDTRVFQYILLEWLPASGFVLDDRPHLEILGPGYRNADPASEEEIWLPVRPRPVGN
ncbi:GyrI-like domain-containing protein [Hymenobacter sp. J193]|uniref:GyrI-like domain-containing protein n=1 Tax=Hymenobacter sp. J193 TaxID=2898429 RepID=UPI002150D67B|nr:GyrI-like domain-containing protein [Hymenobacter sp. J193]MCR5890171.1 GyrI-like domain-containing protein [Hymenobacter sp. J193]